MNALHLEFHENSCNGKLVLKTTDKQLNIIPGIVKITNVSCEIEGTQYSCTIEQKTPKIYCLEHQNNIYYSEYVQVLDSIYQQLKLYSQYGEVQYSIPEETMKQFNDLQESQKQQCSITFTIEFTLAYNCIKEYNNIEQQLPYVLNFPKAGNSSNHISSLEIQVKYDETISSFLFGQQTTQFTIVDYIHGITRFIVCSPQLNNIPFMNSCIVVAYESIKTAVYSFRIPTFSEVQVVTLKLPQQQSGNINSENQLCIVPFTSQPAAVAAALLLKQFALKFLSPNPTIQQYHVLDVSFKYFYIAKATAELQLLQRFASPDTSSIEKQQMQAQIDELKHYWNVFRSTVTQNTCPNDLIFFIQKIVQPYGCNFIPLDTVGSITEEISIGYLDYVNKQEHVNLMRALQINKWEEPYLHEKQQAVYIQTIVTEVMDALFGQQQVKDLFDYSTFPQPIQEGQSFTFSAYLNQIKGHRGQYEFGNTISDKTYSGCNQNNNQTETIEHGSEGFSGTGPYPLTVFLYPENNKDEKLEQTQLRLKSLDECDMFKQHLKLINSTEYQKSQISELVTLCQFQPYECCNYRKYVIQQCSNTFLGQVRYLQLVPRMDQNMRDFCREPRDEFLNIEIYLDNIKNQSSLIDSNVDLNSFIANVRFPLREDRMGQIQQHPQIVKNPNIFGYKKLPQLFYETFKPYNVDCRWYALFSWDVWLRSIATGLSSLSAFDSAIINGVRNARTGIQILYSRRLDNRESPESFTKTLLRSKCLLDRSVEAGNLERWLQGLQEVQKQLRGTALNVDLMKFGHFGNIQKSAVEFLITAGDIAFFLNTAQYLASIRHFGQKEVGYLIATIAPGLIQLVSQLFTIFGVRTILKGTDENVLKGTCGSLPEDNQENDNSSNYSQVLIEYISSHPGVNIPTGTQINNLICIITNLLSTSFGGQTTPQILYCMETFPYTAVCDLCRFLFNNFAKIQSKLQAKPVNSFILAQLRLTGWDLTQYLSQYVEIELLCFHIAVSPWLVNHNCVRERIEKLLLKNQNETCNSTPGDESAEVVPGETDIVSTVLEQENETNGPTVAVSRKDEQVDGDAGSADLFNKLYSALIGAGQRNHYLQLLFVVLANEISDAGTSGQLSRLNYALYELLAAVVGPYKLTHTHFINYNAKLLGISPSGVGGGVLSVQTRLCEQCVFGSCTCSKGKSSSPGVNYDGLYDQLDDVVRIFGGVELRNVDGFERQFQVYKTTGTQWDEWKAYQGHGMGQRANRRFAALLAKSTEELSGFHKKLRALAYIRTLIQDTQINDNSIMQLFTGFSVPLYLIDKQITKKFTLTCTLGGETYTVFERHIAVKEVNRKK